MLISTGINCGGGGDFRGPLAGLKGSRVYKWEADSEYRRFIAGLQRGCSCLEGRGTVFKQNSLTDVLRSKRVFAG